MEKVSHRKVFESHASFLYMMRARGTGGLKSFNTKHNHYWSSSQDDDPQATHRHLLMGMLFLTTTKDSLKSTDWVLNKLALDKHKKRLALLM